MPVLVEPAFLQPMETISNKEFGGERPLFAARDLRLEHVTIHAGESALKCTRNI